VPVGVARLEGGEVGEAEEVEDAAGGGNQGLNSPEYVVLRTGEVVVHAPVAVVHVVVHTAVGVVCIVVHAGKVIRRFSGVYQNLIYCKLKRNKYSPFNEKK